MTFDDIREVDIDEDAGVFTIIKDNGKAYYYFINVEIELLSRILDYSDFIKIYSVQAERENIVSILWRRKI